MSAFGADELARLHEQVNNIDETIDDRLDGRDRGRHDDESIRVTVTVTVTIPSTRPVEIIVSTGYNTIRS